MPGCRCLRHETCLRPGAACIVSAAGDALTWQQLLAQLERTRAALRALGLGANDRVAIVLANGPTLAVAFLTVAACAACAPLNPAYGVDELVFYLTDLKAQALIASEDAPPFAIEAAAQVGIPVIELVPAGDGTTLRFTHRDLPSGEAVQSHAHGWDHYFERLAIAAKGVDPGVDPWLTGDMT